MDPDILEIPTDYNAGIDFRITKTTKGQYADYSTSKWARKETALTDEQRNAVESYGLFTLSDFLPKRPGSTEVSVIKEMFEASVDGQPYDVEKFGQYFRPYGVDAPAGSFNGKAASASTPTPTSVASAPVAEVAPVEVPVVAPTPDPVSDSGSKSAEDILAMIRSRQKA